MSTLILPFCFSFPGPQILAAYGAGEAHANQILEAKFSHLRQRLWYRHVGHVQHLEKGWPHGCRPGMFVTGSHPYFVSRAGRRHLSADDSHFTWTALGSAWRASGKWPCRTAAARGLGMLHEEIPL